MTVILLYASHRRNQCWQLILVTLKNTIRFVQVQLWVLHVHEPKLSCLILTVESFDRSTTREYGDLSKDISSKYDALKKSENEVIKQENEHYKSILKQVS